MEKKKRILTIVSLGIIGIVAWYGFVQWRGSETGKSRETSFQSVPTNELKEASDSAIIDLHDGQSFDMTIVPVRKTIAGQTVRMLGYNGSIPGPLLRVPEGAEITIHLKNGGDIPTTLHSHGVRMENAFDGVPGLTQKEIAPGESFSYTLKFSDPGAFWYHPHVRTDYALESGLYGNFIVTPKDAGYWPAVNREEALMLDDIALDKQGLLPFDDRVANHTLMGRFGNVMLINGETDYRLQAKQGEVVRLYLTNAANTRLFNVAIPGAKMKLVGADMGRYVNEKFMDEILIAPGERRVIDVLFDRSGEYALKHKTPGKEYTLGKISVSSEKIVENHEKDFSALRLNAPIDAEMRGLAQMYGDKTPDKRLTLSLNMSGDMRNMMNQQGAMGSMGGGHMMPDGTMMGGHDMASMGQGDDGDVYEWEDTMAPMNNTSNTSMMQWQLVDDATGKKNMDISDWKFKVGDKVKIRIFNDPRSMHPMQHPIHFHGQRFVVLSTNGVKNDNMVWQDTALIGKGDSMDILLDVSNPGNWMVHCHILEHAESGMMLPFTVSKTE